MNIKDTGIGLDEQAMDKIFERFYRAVRLEIKKMGLGLSIVQEVLSYHNASIEVESNINKGTTFIVSFQRVESIH